MARSHLVRVVTMLIYMTSVRPLPTKTTIINLEILKLEQKLDQIWRRPELKEKLPIRISKLDRFVSHSWSNCKLVKISYKSGMLLAVRDGIVRGFTDMELRNGEGIFQIESYGRSIVRIMDANSRLYISISKRGHVGVTNEKTDKSLLFNYREENGYDTLASVKYYIKEPHDLFISVRRNGKIRPVRKTKPGSSQFLFLEDLRLKNRECIR